MIGVDLVEIKRFENCSQNLIKKVLHIEEIGQYYLSENKPRFIATRWAIKEALFKADNSNFTFNEINLSKVDDRYFFTEEYEISTSDEKGLVIAFVIKKK